MTILVPTDASELADMAVRAAVTPDATHLFEEAGKLKEVVEVASE